MPFRKDAPAGEPVNFALVVRRCHAPLAIRERAGIAVWPWLPPWADRLEAELNTRLGRPGLEAAVRAGAEVRVEDVVEAVLAATASPAA